jgi:hypothetical protein
MSGVGLGAGSWLTGSTVGYMAESMVGFLDASQVSLSINDGSRTLTVTPTGANFTIYSGGNKFVLQGAKTTTWTTAEGLHFFYFDTAGNLQSTTTFTPDIITKFCFVSLLYWDATNSAHIYWGNERHGVYMGTSTHLYLHNTRGAQWDNGLSLLNFQADGTGSAAADAQFTSAAGVIWDEDIRYSIPAQTQFPIYYRSGANWRRKAADSFPLIYNGTAGYTGTRIPYNLNTGGTWSLQEVAENKFALIHVLATNDIDFPVVGILGVAEYANKSDARANVGLELQGFTGLPFAEFTPLGSVIYETNSTYSNTPKARVVSVSSGVNYADLRASYFRPGTL